MLSIEKKESSEEREQSILRNEGGRHKEEKGRNVSRESGRYI
jgi:hypothetical protein